MNTLFLGSDSEQLKNQLDPVTGRKWCLPLCLRRGRPEGCGCCPSTSPELFYKYICFCLQLHSWFLFPLLSNCRFLCCKTTYFTLCIWWPGFMCCTGFFFCLFFCWFEQTLVVVLLPVWSLSRLLSAVSWLRFTPCDSSLFKTAEDAF